MKTYKVTATQKAFPYDQIFEVVKSTSKKAAIEYVKACCLSVEFYKNFKAEIL